MNKILIGTGIGALLFLSGCQTIQDQTNSLSQQGQQIYTGLSQQTMSMKDQALAAKAQFDEKSQEVVTTVNDFNKLTK